MKQKFINLLVIFLTLFGATILTSYHLDMYNEGFFDFTKSFYYLLFMSILGSFIITYSGKINIQVISKNE